MLKELERLRQETARLTQRLKESEDRFFEVFHSTPTPMIITTAEGRIVDLNEANAELCGLRRDDLIGRNTVDAGLWKDSQERDEFLRMLKMHGRVKNFEMIARTKSGQNHVILLTANPVKIEGQDCILGISTDITTQKNQAEIISKSEEKFRRLVENSLQGLAIIQNGRIVYCNRAYAAISGYSVEELLSFPDTKTLVHPDDHHFVFGRNQDRITGISVPDYYEHRIVRKDGTVRWVEIHASLTEYNGMPATQIVDMDITERRLAEDALKDSKDYLYQIINCIGDPVFVKDRQHRFVLVNDALCRTTGVTREGFIGKTGCEIFPNEPSFLWEREEQVFVTGQHCVAEDDFVGEVGQRNILMTHLTLLNDKDGSSQIIGVLRDIKDIKRLEAQLLQSQKMEAIGVLAGGIAHDFNNLLSVIKGYTELLMGSCDSGDPKYGDLEEISKAGHRASTLVSQLLAFSRKQMIQTKRLDLNALIDDMSTMLRRLIGEDVTLATVMEPDLAAIEADPGQIQQIIMNIAVNAREAMPFGGRLVIQTANIQFDEQRIQEYPMASPGSYVIVTFGDNGTGMDAETQSHIFEPFFTTKEKSRGTGLGLSTVYGIVKQNNGFIWVESEPGIGTTIRVCLPSVAGKASHAAVADKEDKCAPGSETILIIEDEAAVRTLASRILSKRGYTVLEAAEGNEALRIVREFSGDIQLVLSDVVMPGISGSALMSEIKALRPGIKSMFFSGYTDSAVARHGVANSEVAFLQKPFTIEALVRKVREVIQS